MAEVVLDRLTKRYGDHCAVDAIALRVRDGELLVVVGPSGCGKTTTLRMIAGLDAPSAGDVRIGDRVVTRTPPQERNVAMVFQDYALYPHMTAYENLAFGLKVRRVAGTEIRQRVRDAAALLGITDVLDRRPSALSGGEQQRVAVGRALVRQPDVFLLDEPLSNLDAQLRTAMRTELVRMHRRLGTTTIHVTHDQTEAMMMGQRVVVMDRGRIRQLGPPMEIYRKPADRFVAEFVGSPPMNFFDGHLVPGDAPTLRVDGQRWPVPPELAGWRGAETPVAVGVRPEALAPTAEAPAPDRLAVRLDCEVEFVQPTGAESIALLRWRGRSLRASLRFPQAADWEAGERVRLAAAGDSLHVFDRREGRRLGGAGRALPYERNRE